MRNFQKEFEEEERDELRNLHRKGCIAILIAALFLALACAATSCKSLQSETKYNYRDSTITHIVYDTIRVTITDTLHVTQSNESYRDNEKEIQFGEGGGTYNAQTGDATNVTRVNIKSTEKELQQMVLDYKHIADSLSATNESLRHALAEAHGEEHVQQNTKDITPRSGWDRFCTWWTVGSWVVLLLLLVYACWRVYRKYWLHI